MLRKYWEPKCRRKLNICHSFCVRRWQTILSEYSVCVQFTVWFWVVATPGNSYLGNETTVVDIGINFIFVCYLYRKIIVQLCAYERESLCVHGCWHVLIRIYLIYELYAVVECFYASHGSISSSRYLFPFDQRIFGFEKKFKNADFYAWNILASPDGLHSFHFEISKVAYELPSEEQIIPNITFWWLKYWLKGAEEQKFAIPIDWTHTHAQHIFYFAYFMCEFVYTVFRHIVYQVQCMLIWFCPSFAQLAFPLLSTAVSLCVISNDNRIYSHLNAHTCDIKQN